MKFTRHIEYRDLKGVFFMDIFGEKERWVSKEINHDMTPKM